tara:strand:+ start:979 stop:1386 length:408 start_codon:yes stop_codon:yes gene_type:complete
MENANLQIAAALRDISSTMKTHPTDRIQTKLNDPATRHAELGTLAASMERDPEQYFLPTMDDVVNHPKHYNKHGIECIQAIRATLTDEEFRGYCKGNIIKYTWREQYKNKLEDLKKASWYLTKLIQDLDKNENTS